MADVFISYFKPERDLTEAELTKFRTEGHGIFAEVGPDYMPVRNRSNEYGIDRDVQRTQTYTGMGMDINVHDTWAVESPGPVQDRTVEHLGVADKAIITNRRLLLQAIEAVAKGGPAPFSAANGDANPLAIDTVGPAADWQSCWRGEERKRRGKSGWAKASV